MNTSSTQSLHEEYRTSPGGKSSTNSVTNDSKPRPPQNKAKYTDETKYMMHMHTFVIESSNNKICITIRLQPLALLVFIFLVG